VSEPPPEVLTVSQLNRMARLALERSLPSIWIAGEISNLTRAPSGHWYFTLKDSNAAVRCAMFRNRNQFLDWLPGNGVQVEVRAQATLYEPRGEFQLTVEAMRRAGLGALFEAFQRLKEKLGQEGLFEPARKRPLPVYPRRIGIITSPRAAALRDVLTTLRRRWPAATLVLYPSLVQGEAAAGQIASAIQLAGERQETEVLLLVRGGGSIEDLWAFNEEVVARAVAASPIPVVSGVGHETDFTIADFAADLRAPTPTGAAQLVTPDRQELGHRLRHLGERLGLDMERRLHDLAQRLDGLGRRLQHPAARLANQARHLEQLARRLALARRARQADGQRRFDRLAWRLSAAAPRPALQAERIGDLGRRIGDALVRGLAQRQARLNAIQTYLIHLNPQAVLGRGYSIVRVKSGQVLRDSGQLALEDDIDITLARGGAGARITRLN
jgi:exodeoxyribonuclease VII large subunit